MKSDKSCRECLNKRWGSSALCYLCYRKKEKARREEKRRRKDERRKGSKKYEESQRRGLRIKLDKVFAQLIRKVGKCARCGRGEPQVSLQCSHIHSRANLAVRWDELNAKCLCAADHFWWHQNPADAVEWLRTIRTEEQMAELRRRANSVKQWSVPELKILLAELTEKLNFLK